jgi:hypothetical protein
MFSSGRLCIENQLLQYEPAAWHPVLCRLYHLKTDLRFVLTARDIDRIEKFEHSSPFWRYYNLPFIRVWTKKDNDLTDFLLCVGGSGPFMGKVRKRNAELCAKLRESFPTCLNGNRRGKTA